MTAFRNILKLEESRGFNDTAVTGGVGPVLGAVVCGNSFPRRKERQLFSSSAWRVRRHGGPSPDRVGSALAGAVGRRAPCRRRSAAYGHFFRHIGG